MSAKPTTMEAAATFPRLFRPEAAEREELKAAWAAHPQRPLPGIRGGEVREENPAADEGWWPEEWDGLS